MQETKSPDMMPDPPELVPPDAEPSSPRRGSLMLLLLVAFTIFIVLDLAILAYFLLPGKTEKKSQPSVQQKQEHSVDSSGTSQGLTEEGEKNPSRLMRASAIGLRDHWLQLEAESEADGVGDWAGESFAAIRKTALEADRLTGEHRNTETVLKYQEAITALKSLQASRPVVLADALSSGSRALVEGNGGAAIHFFTKALALDPGSDEAKRGLGRAKNMDQVMSLYAGAQAAQKQGDLKAAVNMLVQIRSLDEQFQPAVQTLARIRKQMEDKSFNAAMAGFFQALAEKREKNARSFLMRAEKMRPHSRQVLAGKKQLRQRVVEQTLNRLHKQYVKAVANEQWQQSGYICRQALRLDPQTAFAQTGLEKAEKRLALDRAMQSIIDHPLRLQEKAVLAQARQTLAAARSVFAPGPQLIRQISTMQDLLVDADRRVDVILQSDNSTEIVIYRVGKIGRFNRKTVRLRPGRYTVVGSRQGFRDVRRAFEVRPDGKPPLLQIRCTEVI